LGAITIDTLILKEETAHVSALEYPETLAVFINLET
jgi:inorganic pyrophosphatase/exopolyphosphatase